MKILVTGGAGFIGSQLGFYLLDKGHHQVTLLDNLKYGYLDNLVKDGKTFPNFICMDIRNQKLETLMQGFDIVFHLAGISSLPECQNNPGEAYSTNTAGTAHVLEAARRNNIKRVIFSSTNAIYENETIFPSEESTDPKPTLIYPLTKKNAEDICQSFRKIYAMDIVILRFFNVYGPHMDYQRPNPPLVSYIIKCLLKKESPILHSSGKQARDMIYVSDILSICKKVMTNPKAKNEVFNVGSGTTTTVREVYDYIAKAFGITNIRPQYRASELLWEKYPKLFSKKYPLGSKILKKEVNKYTLASIKKAKKMLGWSPTVPIEDGLRLTVQYALEAEKKKAS